MNTMHKKLKGNISRLLLLIAFAGTAVNGYARDFKNGPYNNRILSINQGYSFSGSGDCWGIGTEISHLKTFAPILFHRESLSSWLINGEQNFYDSFYFQTGVDVTFELGIMPLPLKNNLLSFTCGGCISYQTMNRSYGGGTRYHGKSYKGIANYRVENHFSPGFTLGLNYHARVNSKIWLNTRAAIRAYQSGNMLSIISVGIGFDPSKTNK
jgi:hypothetical protein